MGRYGGRLEKKQAVLFRLVEIGAELFAIAAHLDLPQRNETLRGLFTEEHYRRIAEALERSTTVPELNAGRYHEDYGQFHPGPEFREVLAQYDVQFVRGSDAHVPESVVANNEALTDADLTLKTITPDT
jgi:histidinol-phosphatase (PHP family)